MLTLQKFLDSGHCWAEMTDPDVLSLTVRLNTDRPETVFDAKSNALVPPINPQWIASIVKVPLWPAWPSFKINC